MAPGGASCARPAARSLGCPRSVSGVRPAPRYTRRRRIVSSEEAAQPAGAARERPPRFLGAPAPPRGRSPAVRPPGPGRGAGGGRAGEGPSASLQPGDFPGPCFRSEASWAPPAPRTEGCFGSCRAQRRSVLGGDPLPSAQCQGCLAVGCLCQPLWASAPVTSYPL